MGGLGPALYQIAAQVKIALCAVPSSFNNMKISQLDDESKFYVQFEMNWLFSFHVIAGFLILLKQGQVSMV